MTMCRDSVCIEEVHCDSETVRFNLVNLNTGEIIQKNMSFQFIMNRLYKNQLKRLRRDGWKV